MNIRWTALLSLIALALLAWFYQLNQEDQQLGDLIKKQDSPEYIGQKMETLVFAPTGKKQYLAQSDQVEYYNQDGRTEFQMPQVFLYETEGQYAQQQSWKLSANKAILTKDNFLRLEGNVQIQSLLPEAKLQRLETDNALVNLTNQDISSDSMVKMQGQNFTTTGNKLSGNLQQQIAKLKEQVKTYYEVNNN